MTGQTATGGSVRRRRRAIFKGSRTGWTPIGVLAAASAAALLLAVGPASGQTIESKRAQAEAIIAEVEGMNHELETTIEAWNYANVELDRIDTDLQSNAKHLAAARKSLGVAQVRIQERLRDLYINGEGDSTLEVILGSQSLDDIIARLDAIERVSSQDTRILHTVRQYRKEVETRRENLQEARADQARIVAEQAAQKQSIESQISEQNQLLASVKDEIAEIRAEEQRRQAALAAQARAAAQAAQLTAQATSQESYDEAAVIPTYDADVPAARYGHVVGIALQYLGIPYVWGGSSPRRDSTARASRATSTRRSASTLPHHAASQYNMGTPVAYEQLAPGDLVFFSGLGHVGHLHRRRPVRARAAHRRRREDLQPRRALRLVRRRPPPLA